MSNNNSGIQLMDASQVVDLATPLGRFIDQIKKNGISQAVVSDDDYSRYYCIGDVSIVHSEEWEVDAILVTIEDPVTEEEINTVMGTDGCLYYGDEEGFEANEIDGQLMGGFRVHMTEEIYI